MWKSLIVLVGCQLLFFITTVCQFYLFILKYIDLFMKIAINAGIAITNKQIIVSKMCFFFFQGENAGADSELDESEESELEEVECIGLSEVDEKPVAPPSISPSGPPLASGNKSNRQPAGRSGEEVWKLFLLMDIQSLLFER